MTTIYQKDISQRRKNENLKDIELYYKHRRDKHIFDQIYKNIDDRVCLKLQGEKYWIKSDCGYKYIERESDEKYRLVDMFNNHNFYFYCNNKWITRKITRKISPYLQEKLDEYRNCLIFLEQWNWFKKLIYLNMFFHTDIVIYVKNICRSLIIPTKKYILA